MTDMPGNIIYAECPCGYSEELSPGASIDDFTGEHKLFVMAYNSPKRELITIDCTEAESSELVIIEDPFAQWGFSDEQYLCPACKNTSLTLQRCGLWD